MPTQNEGISCGRGDEGVRANTGGTPDSSLGPVDEPIAALSSSITFRCSLDSISEVGGAVDTAALLPVLPLALFAAADDVAPVELAEVAGPDEQEEEEEEETGEAIGVCKSPSLTM